jgi:anti-sigma B factor antagonist
MDITQREKEGIVILDLNGRLIVGDPVTYLRERISEIAQEGRANMILNMAEVDYIDSTGLGGMVISFTNLKKKGGALKLLKLNKRTADLLVLTKLNTVFQVFDDEQDAVNSFFPNREIKKFDILDFVQQHAEEQ